MKSWQAWLPLSLTLLYAGVHAAPAAELGAVTLLEGSAKLLRGTTWYKVVSGTRVEESDILDVAERSQAQVEFVGGGVVNLVGPGSVYFAPAKTKGAPVLLVVPAGWLKVVAKPPGVQLRTASFNVTIADAIVVMHVTKATVEFFVEHGEGRMVEVTAAGAEGASHELRRGEYLGQVRGGRGHDDLARAKDFRRADAAAFHRSAACACRADSSRRRRSSSITRSTSGRRSPGSRDGIGPCSSGASRAGCAIRRSAAP